LETRPLLLKVGENRQGGASWRRGKNQRTNNREKRRIGIRRQLVERR